MLLLQGLGVSLEEGPGEAIWGQCGCWPAGTQRGSQEGLGSGRAREGHRGLVGGVSSHSWEVGVTEWEAGEALSTSMFKGPRVCAEDR